MTEWAWLTDRRGEKINNYDYGGSALRKPFILRRPRDRSAWSLTAAMSVILSKHGSVRGMEGGVGKAVESFREKTKKLTISPVLQKIQEVGNDSVLQQKASRI